MGICIGLKFKMLLGNDVPSGEVTEKSAGGFSGKDEFGKSFFLSCDQLNSKADPTKRNLKLFHERNKKMIHPKLIKFYTHTLDLIPITELNFKAFTLSTPQPKILRCVLSYLPQLSKLNLCETRLGNSGLYQISRSFEYINNLTHLSIEQNFVNEVGFVKFSKNLRYLTKLEVISIGNNQIGIQGMASFTQAIEQFTYLKEIYVHNNEVDFDMLQILVNTCKCIKSLKLVNLEFNKLERSSISILNTLCISGSIRQLYLRCNLYEDEDIELLLNILPAIEINI